MAGTRGRGAAASTTAEARALLLVIAAGSVVALTLGVYGRLHAPTGTAIFSFGFPTLIDMKVWLATAGFALGLFQLASALRMYGRLGRGPAPGWVPKAHRASGATAVTLTLPVAFHCLWALGFATYSPRVLVHSLAGCLFYGAFVTKVLTLHSRRVPGWFLAWAGGALFTLLVAVWLTSAFWFFTSAGGTVGY